MPTLKPPFRSHRLTASDASDILEALFRSNEFRALDDVSSTAELLVRNYVYYRLNLDNVQLRTVRGLARDLARKISERTTQGIIDFTDAAVESKVREVGIQSQRKLRQGQSESGAWGRGVR